MRVTLQAEKFEMSSERLEISGLEYSADMDANEIKALISGIADIIGADRVESMVESLVEKAEERLSKSNENIFARIRSMIADIAGDLAGVRKTQNTLNSLIELMQARTEKTNV